MSCSSLGRLSVLPILLAGALPGCGLPGKPGGALTEDTGEIGGLASALTAHSAGPYGSTGGTHVGTGSDQLTPVTRIEAWSDSAVIYALKLYWGAQSKVYGDNSHGTKSTLDLTGDYVKKVQYYVEAASGNLKGLKFTSAGGGVMSIGNTASQVAFSGPNHKLTDIETWYGQVNAVNITWGIKVHYTTP